MEPNYDDSNVFQGIVLPLVAYVFTKVIPLGAIPSILFNSNGIAHSPIAAFLTCGTVKQCSDDIIFVVWSYRMPFFKTYDKQLC